MKQTITEPARRTVWIAEVREESVTVDFNHPLTGAVLHFSVEITAIRTGRAGITTTTVEALVKSLPADGVRLQALHALHHKRTLVPWSSRGFRARRTC